MSTRAATSTPRSRLDHRRARQGGFTLIEILVTTAVTIVAFTGLASLQMLALRSADSALDRAQAIELAYEMIDRLRLNRGVPGQAQTAMDGGYDDVTLCDGNDRNADDSRQCEHPGLGGLNSPDRVTMDLRQWWQAADNSELPHWFAGIQRNNNMFLVAVQWDDARAANNAAGGASRESCLGEDMPSTMEEICLMTQL